MYTGNQGIHDNMSMTVVIILCTCETKTSYLMSQLLLIGDNTLDQLTTCALSSYHH
jgi:hypothetical protein